jgi:hypothetical protein
MGTLGLAENHLVGRGKSSRSAEDIVHGDSGLEAIKAI